ncbi:MAG: glycosyltransferase family 1 protein [Candidatus Promineifilaceae bacterium]|nr:glycosyltransferase family 1 protein [Candidatus Promineifilaceae bacterium]
MEIGIDASRAAKAQRTGTEGYAYHLIQALAPLAAERGVRLRLYFNNSPPPGAMPDGKHIRVSLLPFPRLWTHLRLAHALHRRPPDVFFTPAHVIPLTYRAPAVATVHDLGYHFFPKAHTRAQRAYLRWSTRHNVQRAQRIIADSEATRADLVSLYGIAPEKIRVIYPGVDPDLAPVRDEEYLQAVRARYGIDAPYLLYLGTLQPRKNLRRLLRAYLESGVDYHLVLAGSVGWRAQPLLDEVAALPAHDAKRVHLPGFIAEEDKAALLSGAHALLFPSLYEGFGFPVLEAQQCQTPVLCAKNSSLPEVAGAGALLVEAEDTAALAAAIRRMALDDALREQLVEAGAANVARFSWPETARQVLDLLEAVAAGEGRAGR